MAQNPFFDYDQDIISKINKHKNKKISLHKNIVNCYIAVNNYTVKAQYAYFPESEIAVVLFPGSIKTTKEYILSQQLTDESQTQLNNIESMHGYVIDDIFRYCFYNKITVLRYNNINISNDDSNSNGKKKISETEAFMQGTACINYLCSVYESEDMYVPPIIAIGFDEGAAVAIETLLRRPELRAGLIVSPPVHKYNLSYSLYQNNSKIFGILYGKHDQLVSNAQILQFADDLKQKHLHVIYYVTQTGRYIGNTDILLNNVNSFLNYVMQHITRPPIQED